MDEIRFREKRSNSIQINSMNEIVDNFKVFIRLNPIYYNSFFYPSIYDTNYSRIAGFSGFYYKNIFSPDYNPFLVLKDINNPYRHLILFNYHLKDHTYLVFGCIVYIDYTKKYRLDSEFDKCNDVKIISKILFTYDLLFGVPSTINSFFTNQSLFIVLNNYDKNTYEFHFIIFDYFDNFISTTCFNDSIVFGVDSEYDFQLLDKRFVEFSNRNCKSLFIDLFSFCNINDSLNFCRYTYDSFNDLKKYVVCKMEKFTDDKTIYSCEICGNFLSDIEFINGNQTDDIHNVCQYCDLYYKNDVKLCSKFTPNAKICSNNISQCQCQQIHITNVEVKTTLISEDKRFPNRKKFRVEVVKS